MATRQLGRPARGVLGIAARCACGAPAVLVTSPRLPDGTPFPTVYYLSLPSAVVAMSTLEATGAMSRWQAELAEDPELAARYAQAHVAYLADRAASNPCPKSTGSPPAACPRESSASTPWPRTRSPPVPVSTPSATSRWRKPAGRSRCASAHRMTWRARSETRSGVTGDSRHPRLGAGGGAARIGQRRHPRPRILAGFVRILPGLAHQHRRRRDRRRDRHGDRQQPSGSRRHGGRRNRHFGTGRRQRAATGGHQQGARHDGRLAHRRAGPRRRRRHHRGRPVGPAAVGVGRFRRRHAPDPTIRSRTRCAGPWITAPTSSTCR